MKVSSPVYLVAAARHFVVPAPSVTIPSRHWCRATEWIKTTGATVNANTYTNHMPEKQTEKVHVNFPFFNQTRYLGSLLVDTRIESQGRNGL